MTVTLERWRKFSWEERLLNIAAEFSRARNWIREKQGDYANQAILRALELMDLTLASRPDHCRGGFLREFLRLREQVAACYAASQKDLGEFTLLFKGLLAMSPGVHNLRLEI